MAGARRSRYAPAACLLLLTGLPACTELRSGPPPESPTPQSAGALPVPDCTTSVRSGPLPRWARSGFTDDGASYPHVEGLRGEVVGVLFGYPLTAPPRRSRANKILWVAHDPGDARLHIDARLDGNGPDVTRDVGFGGGQSVVDLPGAGCWRFLLRWGDDVTDVVDLPYRAR